MAHSRSEPTAPLLPPNPGVRLVPRTRRITGRTWPNELPTRGRWRVTGDAGAGTTSFLVDTVLQKIRSGADPDGVLVVAASKEAGGRLRREIVDALVSEGDRYAANAPLVRSVHSLAFALLREAREENIRLITGAEQDNVIRELLAGHAADRRGGWPEEVRPALTFVGFARQLRDLLLRAAERGLAPEDLQRLGQRHHRPMWSAAGAFMREYEQTTALAGTHSYSASELVATVLTTDVTPRWHTVIVDDAQHLDPESGELIRRILPPASDGLAVIAGDPAQSVFHFRGASPKFFRSLRPSPEHDVDLGASRRDPARRVAVVDDSGTHRDVVADAVRRAHLEDGDDWRDIAVIVRSTGQLGPVRRALLAAGVPVHLNPTDVVLAEQHIVAAILQGVRALTERLSNTELEQLVLGPVGGADPVTLRRLLRGLRRHDPATRGIETLGELLAPDAELPDFGDALTERETQILRRLRTVLDAGRAALHSHATVEEVLWEVWAATGLSDRLMAAALRGGATGSQADRDLDAMMALFDAAGDFAERRPTASVDSFVRHIEEQELPTGVRDRRSAAPDAVSLLTAHGAVGTQFSTVVVAGVQEGTWPSLGETGSLFGQEDLLDLLDEGIDPDVPVSHAADRLAEERRLFHVAVTRATRLVLVTAVEDLAAGEPLEASRFVGEFAAAHGLDVESGDHVTSAGEGDDVPRVRILSPASLIAELRRAVTDPRVREDTRRQAARQLARLAEEGVPGAHPAQWWTTTTVSTEEPLPGAETLSPSRIEGLMNCPLREVLGKFDEDAETPIHLTRGTLAHAYLEALGNGVDPEHARLLTQGAFATVLDEPEWRERVEKDAFARLLERTHHWLVSTRDRFEQVGVEVDVRVRVTEDLGIRGRIDRLEKDADGAVYVIDLKTGKTPVSAPQAEDNPQLAAYQLALSRGVLRDGAVTDPAPGEEPLSVGGAALVYPASVNKTGAATREQSARTAEDNAAFADQLGPLAAELRGTQLTARLNKRCDTCPVRTICPLQPEGKDLTRG
ncbi:PD-(D/E)XK nuclease family protein [Corynebacterium sp.]|uniref:PD-(D/E)XK nuclease family protein n=1 Tax=Corynebacterium sp. TaxID=1720 RepID=UPI0037361898